MNKFKVHVQYIAYGWCGIELLINGKLITSQAGYLGPNPLASLIEVCLKFLIRKNNSGIEEDNCIDDVTIIWQEEPDILCLEMKLYKNGTIIMHIQRQDDDKNILEEWNETILFEDFKNAIVSEGFRVLNAFGLYGYYVSWSDHSEFPLSALLRLTGKVELNEIGDSYLTELTKEIECLSSFIEKPEIKEETHYDECKLYYEFWQMQCCGDPFAVGDKVNWPCVISRKYKNAHGTIIDFEEDHHCFATLSISGTITQIIAERSEFPKGKHVVCYSYAKTIQENTLKVSENENIFHDDEGVKNTFWGYIITLKDVVVKPLHKPVINNQ